MRYRRDIDGLRALAVVPVLFYHAGIPQFSGGFVGVDVFFVISGYLISQSLLSDLHSHPDIIARFYERRIRRIFPALIFTLAASWIAALVIMLPSLFLDFSKSLIACAFFVSNFYFWKTSGYFETGALMRPLLHTWSLAVEEQFYIFMPLLMAAVHRWGKNRWGLVLWPIALLSLALSAYMTYAGPTANFFLLPTRAWELLLGALVALAPLPAVSNRRWLGEVLAWSGIAMILAAILLYTSETPFPGPSALLPCLGAALIVHVGRTQETSASRLLSLPPVVGVGLISYSLYLVHWPIIVFTRYETLANPTPLQIVLIVLASFVLAYLSWRFVERPFRGKGLVKTRSMVLGGGVVSLGAVALLGLAGCADKGLALRFPEFRPSESKPQVSWLEGKCFFLPNQDPKAFDARTCQRTNPKAPKVLLWGDSFAAHYIPGLVADASSEPFGIVQYTSAGCPPILNYYSYARPYCQAFNRRALQIIKAEGIRQVVLSARWGDLQHHGMANLRGTLDALQRMGVRTYVIGQSPIFPVDVELIGYSKGRGPSGAHSWPISVDPGLNAQLRGLSAGATFVDPIAHLCQDYRCPYEVGGKYLYTDYGHFSDAGSRRAVQAYFPVR